MDKIKKAVSEMRAASGNGPGEFLIDCFWRGGRALKVEARGDVELLLQCKPKELPCGL